MKKGLNKLDIIAQKYGTDKSSLHHNYMLHYYKYFASFCNEKIRLLEIGVGKGNSLRMWADFLSNAELFAIDINPKTSEFVDKKVNLFIGDQADPQFLHSVAKETNNNNWDIIIDDGGHGMEQQIKSFETLFPYLNSGGIYVIEDLHTSYYKSFNGGMCQDGTTIEFLKSLVDNLNKEGMATCGDPTKIHKSVQLTDYALWIDSIHFYLSICFIFKSKELCK